MIPDRKNKVPPPTGELAFEAALDRFSAGVGTDAQSAAAALLAAFPDRRAEIESLLAIAGQEEAGHAEDVLPPLPSQVELDSVADDGDETDRAWAMRAAGGDIVAVDERDSEKPAAPVSHADRLPRRIGNYELLELIDSGGMGDVYKSRSFASVHRFVAVKVIKPEIGGREIMSRFSLECQSLALMNHPCIATVYEGGATDQGEPYLAMELVEGVSLTQYCREHACDLRSRLGLFRKICAGIEHAHQKGVIHRDLKPSNILVTTVDGEATPKVIDFGLAKISNEHAEGPVNQHSSHTQLGQILGTLQYMSPEGATLRPTAIDTRSDVFSLGVVLFELLTGSTPLADQLSCELPIDERLRLVRSQEPVRPSDRLSHLRAGLQQRGAPARDRDDSEPMMVDLRALRGDLDAICQKALALQPADRYSATAALSADIENYLCGQPVSATAATSGYVLRKFVRRYRTPLVVAGGVATLLLVALGLSLRWAIRATTAERGLAKQLQIVVDARRAETGALRRAEQEREIAQSISDFLRLDLLAQASPLAESRRDVTLREVLDQAALLMGNRFDEQPRIKGELLATIASVYTDLSEYETAQPYWIEAYDLLNEFGEDGGYRAMIVNHAAALNCVSLGLYTEAERRLQQNLEFFANNEGLWPDKHRTALSAVCLVMNRLGKNSEASDMLAALILEHEAAGESTLVLKNNWAAGLTDQSRHADALPILEEVCEALIRERGADDAQTLTCQSNLAFCLARCNRTDEALDKYNDLLERRQRIFGPEHLDTLRTRLDIASCMRRAGRANDAIAAMRLLITDCERLGVDRSFKMIASAETLADALFDNEQNDEASAILFDSVERYVEAFGAESHVGAQALARATFSLNNHRLYQQSRNLLNRHWRFSDEVFDASVTLPEMLLVDRWAKAVRGLQDWDTLNAATEQLLEVTSDESNSWRAERAKLRYMAAFGQRAAKHHLEASDLFQAAYQTQLAIQGEFHGETLDSQMHWGIQLEELGRQAEAEEVLRAMLQKNVQVFDPGNTRGMRALATLNDIADHYRDVDALAQAIGLYEFLGEFCMAKLGPDHPETISNRNGLGLALRKEGSTQRLLEAEAVFRVASEAAGTSTKANRTKYIALQYNWGLTLELLEKWDDAAERFQLSASESRLRYGPVFYRAERADIHAAECLLELGEKRRAFEILEPLCEIDSETPTKNIPERLEAIDLLLNWADDSELKPIAIQVQEIFRQSEGIRSLDAWDRSKLAIAAAGSLRRVSEDSVDLETALELNRAAVVMRAAQDPLHYRTANAYRSLGTAQEAVGDDEAAEAAYLTSFEIHTVKPPSSASRKRIINLTTQRIVDLYLRRGQAVLAEQWRSKLYHLE